VSGGDPPNPLDPRWSEGRLRSCGVSPGGSMLSPLDIASSQLHMDVVESLSEEVEEEQDVEEGVLLLPLL